eukprot:1201313-Amphidinium_carterae.2
MEQTRSIYNIRFARVSDLMLARPGFAAIRCLARGRICVHRTGGLGGSTAVLPVWRREGSTEILWQLGLDAALSSTTSLALDWTCTCCCGCS